MNMHKCNDPTSVYVLSYFFRFIYPFLEFNLNIKFQSLPLTRVWLARVSPIMQILVLANFWFKLTNFGSSILIHSPPLDLIYNANMVIHENDLFLPHGNILNHLIVLPKTIGQVHGIRKPLFYKTPIHADIQILSHLLPPPNFLLCSSILQERTLKIQEFIYSFGVHHQEEHPHQHRHRSRRVDLKSHCDLTPMEFSSPLLKFMDGNLPLRVHHSQPHDHLEHLT